jgi:hypothetical protein
MNSPLSILEESISDVGNWRWWDELLPALFVAEFGGVKLWSPPTAVDLPPLGIVSLGIKNPSLVAFITSNSAAPLRPDWSTSLHNDVMEPFAFCDDIFTLQDPKLIGSVIEGCSLEYIVGSEANLNQTTPSLLAFRAGPVGLIVRGEQMAVQPFNDINEIAQAREAWKRYWIEYWARRDTEAPMPKDYACEVCIPRERFRYHEG